MKIHFARLILELMNKVYMRCPNEKAFQILYRRSVRGNQYGRKEELYECEDCSGCLIKRNIKKQRTKWIKKKDKSRKPRYFYRGFQREREKIKIFEGVTSQCVGAAKCEL